MPKVIFYERMCHLTRQFVTSIKNNIYLCRQTKRNHIIMIRKIVLSLVICLMGHSLQAQVKNNEPVRDKNNKYLVWTGNVRDVKSDKDNDSLGVSTEVRRVHSFMERYFPYKSLCDWQPGMRFMVLPEKRDMVVRTFTDSLTDELVSNMSLRYKIMVYDGILRGDLHDRMRFKEEDGDKCYYFELPTKSFEDYCYLKRGVPTLAYLDEIDTAMVYLTGKQLETTNSQYNIDVSTTSYGYDKVPVSKGTIVTVKAVGVGSRSFPVKLIVEDKDGTQFYQNVAISFTNCGMTEEELEEPDNKKHTFAGSFRLLDDAVEISTHKYDLYIGKSVVTLHSTIMLNRYNMQEDVPRLTEFEIKDIKALSGTDRVMVTLANGEQTYKKAVSFVRHSTEGDGSDYQENDDYFGTLFRVGSLNMDGVRESNMVYIRQGQVKAGFTEEEVLLALGQPDAQGSSSRGTAYTWIYKSMINRTQCTVFFSYTTRRVTSVRQ